jgi:hypothetical protein
MIPWSFYLGLRIYIFTIFQILFIFSFFITSISGHHIPLIKSVKSLFILYLLYFLIIIISGLNIYFLSFNDNSSELFIKGISLYILNLVFFISFASFFHEINISKRQTIINTFILGALLSAFWELIQLYLLQFHNINIDAIIWNKISIGYTDEYKFLERFKWGWT